MPQLPTSQISSKSGRSDAPALQSGYGSDALGGAVAGAIGQVGQGLGHVASALVDLSNENLRSDAAASVANFSFAMDKQKLQLGADEKATNYHDNVVEGFKNSVNDYTGKIDDPRLRTYVKEHLMKQLPQESDEAAKYQFKVQADYSKSQANDAISTLQNNVYGSPQNYDLYNQQAKDVIDAQPGLTQEHKMGMKIASENELTRRRFEGLIEPAKTTDQLKSIRAELLGTDGSDWASKIKPSDHTTLINRVDARIEAVRHNITSQARVGLDGMKGMVAEGMRPSPDEQARVQNLVQQSGDINLSLEAARLTRNQDLSQALSRPAADASKYIAQQEAQLHGAPNFPAPLQNALSGISPDKQSFVTGVILKEFGSKLKGNNTDYGAPTDILGADGKPTSSAVGVGQFTEGTFKDIASTAMFATATGLDTSKMDSQQLLDLRKNPEVAAKAIEVLAVKNQKQLETALGRPVTDAELYMAHFMGATGAINFLLNYEANPDAKAASLMPNEAKANEPVFYSNGRERTLGEVRNFLAADFGTSAGKAQYDDLLFLKKQNEMRQEADKKDPMTWAAAHTHAVPDLWAEGGFAATGKVAQLVASFESIPPSEMKPFMEPYANELQHKLETGSAQDVLQIYANVASMDKMAPQAMKQIGDKNPVMGYAGRLYLDQGTAGVAADIVRGAKLLSADKNYLKTVGLSTDAEMQQLNTNFKEEVGLALNGMNATDMAVIKDSALAHWAQTSTLKGASYDSKDYKASLRKVIGAKIEEVNGVKTYMPEGITADAMQQAMSAMKIEDWASMSADGKPPVYADGKPVLPQHIATSGILRYVGGGYYTVMAEDGSFLASPKPTDLRGAPSHYLFKPDAQTLSSIVSREKSAADRAISASRVQQGNSP